MRLTQSCTTRTQAGSQLFCSAKSDDRENGNVHLRGAIDASRLWLDLISGRARITSSGATAVDHYFCLEFVRRRTRATKLTRHRVQRLEQVLLGQPQKAVAAETGCAVSTVATNVSDCLREIGLACGYSHVPALLVMLLHAIRGDRVPVQLEERVTGEGEFYMVRSPRPELLLADELTECEMAVTRYLVEGTSYETIARLRGVSVRTVANQVTSVYRKLRVSGRLELLCHLVARLVAVDGTSRPVSSATLSSATLPTT